MGPEVRQIRLERHHHSSSTIDPSFCTVGFSVTVDWLLLPHRKPVCIGTIKSNVFFGFANVQTIESCFFSSDGFSLNFTVCCFHSNKFSPQAVHLMVVLQKHNQTRTGSVAIHVQALMEGKTPPELLTHLLYYLLPHRNHIQLLS